MVVSSETCLKQEGYKGVCCFDNRFAQVKIGRTAITAAARREQNRSKEKQRGLADTLTRNFHGGLI